MNDERFAIEKRRVLADWEERKQTLMRGARRGGLGYVDPEIVPLCDALNALPGVFTLQSCSGHADDEGDGGKYPGELWLRLDSRTGARFESAAHVLAADVRIERVGKIYWTGGKQTVTITFMGKEAGLLAGSAAIILEFFKVLSEPGPTLQETIAGAAMAALGAAP